MERHFEKSKIKIIEEFLNGTKGKEFSRKEFAFYLELNLAGSYKTAGEYLKILKLKNICVHNGKHANRSAYKLHKKFIKKD